MFLNGIDWYLDYRAVTTIEADEAAASSDFFSKKNQNKQTKKTRKRNREREKEKEQKTIYRFLLFLRVYSVCVAFPDLFLCSMYDAFPDSFLCSMYDAFPDLFLQSVGCWIFYYWFPAILMNLEIIYDN